MILYVEANFILEYVFDQEEGTLVEQIVAHAERGGCELCLPAVALFEPAYRVNGQIQKRKELRERLDLELRHLARAQNPLLRGYGAAVEEAIRALNSANLTEQERLYRVLDRMSGVGRILGITASTVRRARRYQDEYDLSYPDAIVVASVVEDLEHHGSGGAFVCRDRLLTSSEVRTELESRRCVILTNFERAAHFVLREPGAVEPA